MATPIAKLSLEMTKICRDIGPVGKKLSKKFLENLKNTDAYYEAPIMTGCRLLAIETAEKHGIGANDTAVGLLSLAMIESYRRNPQFMTDFIEQILGWRLYKNVHDYNLKAWGYPPQWLGGEGNGWTWKAKEKDFGLILSKIMEKKR